MATNLTPKQEAFVQAYLTTGNASEAYRVAGYSQNASPKTINEAASRLLADSKVAARLSTLRERAVERTMVTVDMLTTNLLRIAQKGEDLAEASGLGVARASMMDVAKLNGLVVDKKEHSGSINLGAALDALDD
ncbi:MAG: terminase small subunit [Novosphingobium sp.]|nr:terminase small subunit [Novosphingobium sp.]